MHNIYLASFGATLKFFRKQQGMTQKQLAAKVGVHANTIWAWERGDYLPETRYVIVEITNQLGLSDFETRQLLEASLVDSPSLSYWSVLSQRNPFFVGRKDVLHLLHQMLQEQRRENGVASYALSGLGGIGKTQTALEYAYLYFRDYAAVFWVDAGTVESILASFVSIAHVLGLPGRTETHQLAVMTAVIEWLNSRSDWLMIIDNVWNLSMVKPSLPSARQGTLLFTTRLPTLGTLAPVIELDPLSLQEGAHLLLRRTQQIDEQQRLKQLSPDVEALAQTLAEAMGGLPLALDQAAAYIEQTHYHIRDVLPLFETYPLHLLSERDIHADHPFSVVETFIQAFEQLQREQPVAAQFLLFCCFFAPDEIPEGVLTAHAKDLELPFKEAVSHPLGRNALFKALLAHSLIRRSPDRQTFSVHRLVQTVLKERLSEQEQKEWNERVICLLHQVVHLKSAQIQMEEQCLYELILPHALYCLQQAIRLRFWSAELASLLSKLATYLCQMARFEEAEALYQQALSTLNQRALIWL